MENMFVNTCIIGGGASGLMCAVALENKDILIIEKQDRIGKKILVTGNGKCNLSNEYCQFCLDICFYNYMN